jgi:hypothetical protein
MNECAPVTDATATVNSVSAAASFTRLSPVSSVRTLRRRPSSRPMARALTASGGAIAAPSTIAVLIVSAGTTPAATAAAAKAVATTSSTPSRRIGTSRRTNDVNENASAVE